MASYARKRVGLDCRFAPLSSQGGSQSQFFVSLVAAWKTAKAMAALPFDAMRFQYAGAVKAGLIENSMLASRDFERALGVLERQTLGPLARRV
jgi:hypothetical protein